MTQEQAPSSQDDASSKRPWLTRRRLLYVVIGALVAYYGIVLTVRAGGDERDVSLDVEEGTTSSNVVDLDVEVVELEPSERMMQLQVHPIPKGSLAGDDPGEFAEDVTLQVFSAGRPPMSFNFPKGQIIDSVGVSTELSSGSYAYPFDRPEANVRFEVLRGEDEPLPLAVAVSNAANEWRVAGSGEVRRDNFVLHLDAKRDLLVISLALFHLIAIVVAAVITVAVIGTSLADGQTSFSEVIWLGATLVAIPAMRSSMPGVPPIGTAVDRYVFFPSVGVVAIALLAATMVLTAKQAKTQEPLGAGE